MFRTMTVLAAIFASGFLSAAAADDDDETGAGANAEGDGKVELGYLECEMVSNEGNIVVSEQQFACTFSPAGEERDDERYIATFSKYGLDLSKTEAETIRWAVLASASVFQPGLLEGKYAGLSADIAVVKGVGARALVGGLNDSITLQPLSLSTQDGVGVSLAFESMELTRADTDN
ncbi:MAG: DUF992 domain-containing protein [Pikeienuella sp.]